ncbi:MAG TPA: phosphatidylglycerophosphatase A [Stellaceae bacterium]|nr:phosphatidylglycerophosphatase A [Stellaceae bacterium]
MSAARLIASWFGSGLLPWAPGTWGSLAALPFAWVILLFGGKLWLLAGAAIVFVIGWIAADRATRGGSDPDPGWVVIDEVAGQWLTLLLLPLTLAGFAIGFMLFRLFDIWKPWPIRAVERRYGGGFGIMIDDVLAAIYAMLVVAIGRLMLER